MKQHILLLIAIALLFAGTSENRFRSDDSSDPTTHDAPSTGTDAPQNTPAAPLPEGDVHQGPVSQYVHSIVLGQFEVIGSCVSIGAGEYVTAKHLFEGKSNPRVMIADHVVDAKVMHRLADISDVVTDGQEPGVTVADEMPPVGSRVQLYGLATAQIQRGRLGEGYVVVDDGPGVNNGDSGGGVFTEDGKLIGIISAFYGSKRNGTANQRQVYFAALSQASSAPAADNGERPVLECLVPDGDWCSFCNWWKQRGDAGLPFELKFVVTEATPKYGYPTFRVPHGPDGREWFIGNSSEAQVVSKWRKVTGN